jgi:hypothetical protein
MLPPKPPCAISIPPLPTNATMATRIAAIRMAPFPIGMATELK